MPSLILLERVRKAIYEKAAIPGTCEHRAYDLDEVLDAAIKVVGEHLAEVADNVPLVIGNPLLTREMVACALREEVNREEPPCGSSPSSSCS